MNLKFTFRGMEHSNLIEGHAREQLDKVLKFLENERTPINIDVVLMAGRPHAHHQAEIRLKTPQYDVFVSDEGPELIKVLDQLIDLTYRKLREQKKKWLDRDRKVNKF